MFKKSKLLFVMPLAVSALMATPVHAEESNVQIPITKRHTQQLLMLQAATILKR